MVLRSTVCGRKVKNFRCLDRAAKHYDAGDLQDTSFAQIDEATVNIKGSCGASMKKTVYVVYVCVTCRWEIHSGLCILLAQSCSHIGGLLFAVSNITTTTVKQSAGQGEDSCTSKLCQWKIPRQV
ncbi:LOW QUALITY PROTEIN: hypothetical protein KUTeg_007764 [Tegillarca granosa]|uniref:Uncharacterized protein n=1 Tax=Tegillarca granosa TaxID=220873 RepID=A0ABQ9FE94_TEGGR|nr:LOW QUALITY PROTEIN: hypothetical protein KUTeg_007764 [Tegillarca granosa]